MTNIPSAEQTYVYIEKTIPTLTFYQVIAPSSQSESRCVKHRQAHMHRDISMLHRHSSNQVWCDKSTHRYITDSKQVNSTMLTSQTILHKQSASINSRPRNGVSSSLDYHIVIEDFSGRCLPNTENTLSDEENSNTITQVNRHRLQESRNKANDHPCHIDNPSVEDFCNRFPCELSPSVPQRGSISSVPIGSTTSQTIDEHCSRRSSKGNLCDDLTKLKALTTRLNLQTRRQSYQVWKNDHLGRKSRASQQEHANKADQRCLKTSSIGESLEFIRNELNAMRLQDQDLARQFIALRHEIQQIRLSQTTDVFAQMVDDAQWSIEEKDELDHVCDEPRTMSKTPLLHVGITKMNLTERRYSVF